MLDTDHDIDLDSIVRIDPNELNVGQPFEGLFPIAPKVLAATVTSMKSRGFYSRRPIEVWRQANLVLDGHTRRLAAIQAGVEAWVTFLDFANEDEAFDYAIETQRDRRNATSAEIFAWIKAVDKRMKAGAKPKELLSCDNNSKRSHVETAEAVGVSPATVSRARLVATDPEVEEQVLAGKMSINAGANVVKAKRQAAKPAKVAPAPPPSPAPVVEEATPEPEPTPKPEAPAPTFESAFEGDEGWTNWEDEEPKVVAALDGFYEQYRDGLRHALFFAVGNWLARIAADHRFQATTLIDAFKRQLNEENAA